MRRAFAVRHVAFEDLGLLSKILEERNFSSTYLDAGVDRLADVQLSQDDLLVVLGGPIGAYEEDATLFLLTSCA